MQEVPKTEYLPAVTVTVTKTQVVYRTSTYIDYRLVSRYTTVAVPVYVTNTVSRDLIQTKYATSTAYQYTTVIQVR